MINRENSTQNLPIVLGITGASGTVYGIKLLKFLVESGFQVELILSKNCEQVFYHELDTSLAGLSSEEIKKVIFQKNQINGSLDSVNLWNEKNFAASPSSGSHRTQGMIIAPCSMGTLANIAAGTSNNLIARAADVCLKESRKLILVAREAPLSKIHLRNMLTLSEMGATILPASPGFYHRPQTIDDQINFVLGKTLDVFFGNDFNHELFKRWATDSNARMPL